MKHSNIKGNRGMGGSDFDFAQSDRKNLCSKLHNNLFFIL